jgi:putative ABC transport system permease protein
MKKGFLKVTLRGIIHHRLISVMTMAGLAIGLAGSIFIGLWVSDELGFDRFNKLGDRLYRVEEDQLYDNGVYHVNVTPWPSGPVWKERIPEIENSCRTTFTGSLLMRSEEKVFNEEKAMAVDTTFFNMFTYQLVFGNKKTVLREPGSIVISADMAKKYFGNKDPIGKSIEVNNSEVFQVTGIMKRMPENSSFDADFLISFDFMKRSRWYSDNWSNNSITTNILLAKGSNPDTVNRKITAVVKEHSPDTKTKFVLFPFLKIHLHSYGGFGRSSGAMLNVWIFSSVALLVLIIACINFMNISTARSVSRAKETGLRKLNGASRPDLMIQFFGESMFYSFASMVLAIGLVLLLLGTFNQVTGKSFIVMDLFKPAFILRVVICTAITGIIAGSYPAIVLSSFKPIDTLKDGNTGGTRGRLFRRITVVIQFSISIVLILFTFVTYLQLKFMLGKSLGFDKENLIYVQMKGNMTDLYPVIKEEFLKDPAVVSVTASTNPPHAIGNNADNIWWEGKSPEVKTLVSMAGIDFDYVETMGIKMKSGRSFSRSYSMDIPRDTVGTFLINEQLEKMMGTDDAVGKPMKFGNTRGQIVGVMKDFNYQSLHSKVDPLALWIWPAKYLGFIYIRIKPGNLHESISGLEKVWSRVVPRYPFDFYFLDQEIDKMYRVEERTGKLLGYFSALSIIVACIGLFGLATYTVERRRREMGIRKVLGASGYSIFSLIANEFIPLLLIASGIIFPLSYFFLRKYLSNWGYHIELRLWIFILAFLIVFMVAAIAICYQIFTAIRDNPSKSLKYE